MTRQTTGTARRRPAAPARIALGVVVAVLLALAGPASAQDAPSPILSGPTTADAAVAISEAGDLGVQLFAKGADGKPLKPEIAINLAAVNRRLLSLARQQSDDMRAQLAEAGVRIINGHGRLEGDSAVVVSTGPGGTDFDRVEADTLVV